MNPSATGWIKKHLPTFLDKIIKPDYAEEAFYEKLKSIGFIYANSVSTLSYPDGSTFSLTLEELSKINLFDSLGYIYFKRTASATTADFFEKIIAFYDYLKKNSWFDFQIPFLSTSKETALEKIIQKRIQTNESAIQRNFSTLISNALLFLDVLTFNYFLKAGEDPVRYAKSLEAILANTVYIAFKQKSDKNTQEELVMKLMETSIRYNRIEEISLPFEKLNYGLHKGPLECKYILDLACMTVYSDQILEEKEHRFIRQLSEVLGFQESQKDKSIRDIKIFIEQHKKKITYLDYSNPFRNLYDNTTRMVKILILRNKKRLIKEIGQSRELVTLLSKSAKEDLNDEEKQKVKTQLLDICKVIPSLAIFLLPGGSILLPLLIKFIPNLLPSAFVDNK